MATRARQQAVVAELGQRALAGVEVSVLLEEAVAVAARTLEADFATVLELLPDGRAFRARAGLGSSDKVPMDRPVGAGSDSLAGYVLLSDRPVISEDLRRETRFSSGLLQDFGAVSGVSVIVHGPGQPFGVLGTFARKRRRFTDYDGHFLQAVANVLASALERERAEAAVRLQAHMLDVVGQAVVAVDLDGTITYWNRFAETLYGWTTTEAVGQSAALLVPPASQELAARVAERLKAGESWNGEFLVQRRDGTSFTALVSDSPIRDEHGAVVGYIGVSADISERKRAEEAQRFLALASKELANSLDFETTVSRVARLAVPVVGDWCEVHIVDEDGSIRRIAAAHVVPEKQQQVCQLPDHYLLDAEATAGVSWAIREARVAMYPTIPVSTLWAFARDADHFGLLRELDPRSAVFVPLLAGGRPLGALAFLITESDRRFGPADLVLAEDIAGTIALAIDNARMFRREQERRYYLETIRHVAAEITGELDLTRLLELIIRRAAEVVGSDSGLIALWDEEGRSLVPRAWFGFEPWIEEARFDRGEGVGGAAAQGHKGLIVNDYRASEYAHPLLLERSDITAALAEPLLYGDRLVGVLAAFRRGAGRDFSAEDQRAIRLFADPAAIAIENARLYRELAEREQRLHDLVGQLLLAQEEERRRVAYEIHDGLAQVAAGAHQHIQSFVRYHRPRSKQARETLDRALQLAERTVREARGVISGLRPTVLDDFGLGAAIRLQVEALCAEGWDITYDEGLGAERLPPPIETALYRLAQEALTNVRKHAGTTRVRVTLQRDRQNVCLEIRDWGRGFRPSTVRAGPEQSERIGLPGMQERMALLGGRCTVRSRRGTGTSVLAEVPLPPQAAEVADDG